MSGTIESYDPATETGTISSEGRLLAFRLGDWVAVAAPEAGDAVRFIEEEGVAKSVDLVGAYLEKPRPVKYKYLAALLAFTLGWAGGGRLYLGFYRLAFAQMLVTFALFITQYFVVYAPVWGFIECVLILAGHINQDAKGRPFK